MNNISTATASTTQLQNNKNTRKPASTPLSFAPTHSSPLFKAGGTSSSSTLQALIQLILSLISQLREQQEGGSGSEQDSGDQQDQDQPQNPSTGVERNNLVGTLGNDRLTGSRSADHISGLAGNDRLSGRQGDDVLKGGAGRDRLIGGKGNDELFGGAAKDRLYGGQGDDKLFGGAGNDRLNSRHGSNTLDGGAGNDTARIRANFDDFSITSDFNPPGSADGDIGTLEGITFTLSNEKTGETVTATNIETYKFDDKSLSTEALLEHTQNNRVEPPVIEPPTDHRVPLTAAQEQALQAVTGLSSSNVIDADNSGSLTEGDYIDQGGTAYVLTKAEVEEILNFQPPSGELTATQTESIQELTGFTNFRIDDNDLSDSLNEGDEVVSEVTGERVKLSAEDVTSIINNLIAPPNELIITDVKKDKLASMFSVLANDESFPISVQDSTGDGELNAGDTLKASVGVGTPVSFGEDGKPVETRTVEFTLTEDNIKEVKGEFGVPLDFTREDLRKIDQALDLQSPNGGTRSITEIYSKSGIEELRVGDVARTMPSGLTAGGSPLTGFAPGYHRLTNEDIRAINDAGISVELTKVVLSDAERSRLSNAIGGFLPFGSVIDNDSDGKVSVDDRITTEFGGGKGALGVGGGVDGVTGFKEVSYKFSQSDVDRYNGGQSVNTIDASVPQDLAISQYLQTEGSVIGKPLDVNGNGELGEGDIVRIVSGNTIENHTLTTQDISSIAELESQINEIVPTDAQDQAIRSRYSFDQGKDYFLLDEDNSGALNTGDRLIISGAEAILGAEDIDAINDTGNQESLVELSSSQ